MENIKCEGPTQLLNDRIYSIEQNLNMIIDISTTLKRKLFGEENGAVSCGGIAEEIQTNTEGAIRVIEGKVNEIRNLISIISDRI